jgi:hypothetical protein
MTTWKSFFDTLNPGLTLTEIARRLGKPHSTIRSAALRARYAFTDGRRYGQQPNRRFVPEDADWSRSNVELSRKYGVSRERIRFLRTELGHPKVGKRGPKPKKDHGKRHHNKASA